MKVAENVYLTAAHRLNNWRLNRKKTYFGLRQLNCPCGVSVCDEPSDNA